MPESVDYTQHGQRERREDTVPSSEDAPRCPGVLYVSQSEEMGNQLDAIMKGDPTSHQVLGYLINQDDGPRRRRESDRPVLEDTGPGGRHTILLSGVLI